MKLVTALLLSAVSATAVAGPNIALIGEYTFVGMNVHQEHQSSMF